MKRSISGMTVKERILAGELVIGSWLQIGHPAIMEYMASYAFDWLTIDLEHSDITIERFTNMLRGADTRSVDVFARVKKNSTLDIRQVLDVGASGVIVPLVNNAEEAKKAVAAAKYAPEGERGFAFCRANGYGKTFDEYTERANRDTIVIIMIESKEAIEHIDEILLVKGVDGVIIGPYDLSGSYGIPGQLQSSCVQEAMEIVLKACRRHHKAAGMHLVLPDEESIASMIEKGFKFLAIGMDNVFLGQAIEESLHKVDMVLERMQASEKEDGLR